MWIIKIKCFYPRRILEKNWCIYSCLQTQPRDQYIYIWKYATVFNFPCLITLQGCMKKDPYRFMSEGSSFVELFNKYSFFSFWWFVFYPTIMSKRDKYFLEYYMNSLPPVLVYGWFLLRSKTKQSAKFSLILRMTFFWRPETL